MASKIFYSTKERKKVVVVAMKSHLRGRIRRTVSAYLEQGAHVVVLALASGDDFLVGFKHENLNVYGIEVRSGLAGVERALLVQN